MFLNKAELDRQEELCKEKINNLTDNQKKFYYSKTLKELKDPDTYAVINWFFIAGIHHFYLKKYNLMIMDLMCLIIGITLIVYEYYLIGAVVLMCVSAYELYHLFFSQHIVQNYNIKIMNKNIQLASQQC